ncbi:MAG TPA: glycosyltransferase [bacterium]|nr:glycosyltransferase [bacterium]
METVFAIVFWGCFGILLYVYVGYPVLLLILSFLRPVRHAADESFTPSMSLLFSARNEIESLPAKLQSARELNYPRERLQILAASDASTDGSTAYLAAQKDIGFVELPEQGGKNAALNRLLPLATGDLLFFTDANTILHPGCARAAARHFGNPRVGVVVGELVYAQGDEWNAVGQGAGLYWRYENIIKRLESRLGNLLVGGGALLIARREIVAALDPRIANDLEIPARAGAQGYYVLYEPACLGSEKAHTEAGEEWGRTSRIVARGLRGFMMLGPVMIQTPLRFWQFLSHKFLRWFTLPFSLLMLAAAWPLREHGFPWLIGHAGLVILLSALLGIGLIPCAPASRWIRPFTLMGHLLIMHAAALWGITLAILGRAPATWTVPQSTRS